MRIRANRSSGRLAATQAMSSLLSAALVFGTSACSDVPTAPATSRVADTPPVLAVSMGPSGYSYPYVLSLLPHGASGINNQGAIIGGSLLYTGGTVKDIGKLPGDWSSYASDINDKGQIVGESVGWSGNAEYWQGNLHRAFIYDPGGGMIDIHSYADLAESKATAINNASTVAGTTVVGCGRSAPWAQEAFRWTPYGGFQKLVAKGGWNCANDVNDAGIIVGSSSDTLTTAYMWSADGSGWSLGTLGGAAHAEAINNSGWVAGYSRTGAATHGFLWTWFTGMVDLGPLSLNYKVRDISDKGRIVGYDYEHKQAFTWYKGVFSYLPRLAPDRPTAANAINACGTIAGTATDAAGVERAVRWSRRTCD